LVGVADLAGDALVGFIKAGVEGQEVEARLTQSLNKNVEGWHRYERAMEDATDAAVKMGFQDDDQQESLAQLVTQTKSVTDAIKIQRVAMDLARLKSMSLKDASALLGKAWIGNTTALRRMGVQIDRNAKGMDVLSAVEAIAGGQAEAFADTFEGATARMGAEIARLQQELGMKLVPVVTEATKSFNDLAFGTDRAVETIEKAADRRFASAMKRHLALLKAQANRPGANLDKMVLPSEQSIEQQALGIGKAFGKGIEAGLKSNVNKVAAAAADLQYAMKHPMAIMNQPGGFAWAVGQLQGKDLAKGLNSKKPEVLAAALAYRKTLTNILNGMPTFAWGSNAAANYLAGLRAAGLMKMPSGWGIRFSGDGPFSQYPTGNSGGGGGGGNGNAGGGGHNRGGHHTGPSGFGVDQHIHLNLDGKEVAHVVNQWMGRQQHIAGRSHSRN
jgi:hypothetical protein